MPEEVLEMAMSPNCADTEYIPSKMVAGDREILGIGENPKSFGESRIQPDDLGRETGAFTGKAYLRHRGEFMGVVDGR